MSEIPFVGRGLLQRLVLRNDTRQSTSRHPKAIWSQRMSETLRGVCFLWRAESACKRGSVPCL